MRHIPAWAILVITTAAAAACSGDASPPQGSTTPSAASATPTYRLPSRPVRDGETPLSGGTVRSGDLAFTPIGLRAGMPELVGSHADVRPKGQFVRIRLVTENRGRTTQTFDSRKQLLVTTDGATHQPDLDAMLVKRQPDSIDVGSAVRIELDLWYDIPRESRVRALRLVGTPSVGAVSDPPGVDVGLS
ncbi:DUF4352 domain-containing protein [Actinomadura sp. HBU206391]|uniref:DUF4352 domain-containing protein n=1 Tax=Actinomadura sp. HBU206391 TaxID=2731692 RepID=UPI00164FADE6|nr:DUF4352 domain-containing protein [Actinomadura sp. HBU206391]MBC6461528.1 DUF4352 domain-containing protein [Actinomadura sp. HBU206391]